MSAAVRDAHAFRTYGEFAFVHGGGSPCRRFFMTMTDYEKICDFQNLYKAHKFARLGKRDVKEVIDFELNLAKNLTRISDSLKNKTYQMSGYYSFYVHDPKERKIHALRVPISKKFAPKNDQLAKRAKKLAESRFFNPPISKREVT